MADTPSSESRVNKRVGNILKVRREDLADGIRATLNHCQEGKGGKLSHSVNAIPPTPAGREALSLVLSSARLNIFGMEKIT